MDLFEQQKAHFNKTMAHAADLVHTTRTSDAQRERSQSPGSSGGSSLERGHRRAGSTDLQQLSSSREGSPFEGLTPTQSGSLKEALNKATSSSAAKSRSLSSAHVVAAGPQLQPTQPPKNQLPMHLKSATSDVKTGSVVQQLPFKLASAAAGGGKSGAGKAGSASGMKQVLPFKLSSHTTGHSPQQASSPASHHAVTSSTSSPVSVQRTMTSQNVDPSHRLQHTRSQPSLPSAAVAKPRTMTAQNSLSNVLPLKLAESAKSSSSSNRPRSASSHGSRNAQPVEHKDSKSGGGKKEPEIIYF